MPKILTFFLLSLIFASCVQDTPKDTPDAGDDLGLQNRIDQLELDNALKDSVINEALSYFNEIKENIESIGIRKDEIRDITNNPEISNDDKEWVLEQIRHINFLREENARKVKQLKTELKVNNLMITELQVMVESLNKDIQWKDEQISLLQKELDNVDKEYSALFDAYQEQSIKVDDLTNEMNTVHYAYGTEEELRDNRVIEKKNGFIGIGKKTELKDDFNDKYFTSLDITKTKSIKIDGTNLHFITMHPTKSYELVEQGNRTIVKIIDASEFWKVSKYLVIVVD